MQTLRQYCIITCYHQYCHHIMTVFSSIMSNPSFTRAPRPPSSKLAITFTSQTAVYFTHFSMLFDSLNLILNKETASSALVQRQLSSQEGNTPKGFLILSGHGRKGVDNEEQERKMDGLSNITNHRDSWKILKGWALIQAGERSVLFSFNICNPL